MSELFQSLKTSIESGITTLTTKAPEAAKALKAMIDEYGGIQNFIAEISKDVQAQLKEKGVPEKAKAWIEDGKKFVLSQEQVKKLMGNERIQKVAEKLKTTPDRLATLLGEALPPVLEKFEQAKAAIDSASKSVPENSFVGGILKKVSNFLGNPSSAASTDKSVTPDDRAPKA